METLFSNKNQCCGCTACANVCPKGAISMNSDDCGFLYPQINTELCIDCGLCKKVCAFANGYENKTKMEKQLVYAAKQKDNKIRSLSSSGGTFSALCSYVAKNGGVVYGVAFDDEFNATHICGDSAQKLEKLKSSKYVQSKLNDTFKAVRTQLEQNVTVMFSGTGCQVQGLKEFLRKDYENLILVDIVCHGVPSPKVFDDYKKMMSEKYTSSIANINFRAKKIHGETQDMQIDFENGKTYSEYPDVDVFKKLFSSNLTLRPSCFECKYANTNRTGDITLGDFWGISKTIPSFDDAKGVSLVIINTQKGKKIFDAVSDNLILAESCIENALQPNLKSPTKMPENYSCFWDEYCKNGFDFVAKKYACVSSSYAKKRRFKTNIKKLLGK